MPFIILGLGLLAIFLLVKNVAAFEVSTGKPYSVPARAPVVPYEDLIRKASQTWGVDLAIIKAVIRKESAFNPEAVNPTDPSYGLMGITPIAAQDFGFVRDYRQVTETEIATIFQVENNLNIGVRKLSSLLRKYPFDAAVQMYNVGESGYKDKGRRNFSYLSEVKRFYNEYKV